MGPDPFCPSWLIYYELAFTNTHESAIANLVITSPLPGWPCNGAWLDETSTLDGELDGYTSMFVFGAESVAAGETVYARTILRSYSTVSGLVKNAFYVSADDLAATETYTYAALASNGVCDAPTPTPAAEPEPTILLKGLFLPLIDSR